MSEILEKSVFNYVREMTEDDKNLILETCFSSALTVSNVITDNFNLRDWFDVYLCSDEYAKLTTFQKKHAVKGFRDLYEFIDVLNLQMDTLNCELKNR